MCDLICHPGGGRVLHIEAKSCTGDRFDLRQLEKQSDRLLALEWQGYEVWIVLLWRTKVPPFVNQVWAILPSAFAEVDGASVRREWCAEHGLAVPPMMPCKGCPGGRGWDLTALIGLDADRLRDEELEEA